MERRAASHTEEEEMNQRRKLLNAARRGDTKAISKLFELYQVRVLSGDQLAKVNKTSMYMAPVKNSHGSKSKTAEKKSKSTVSAPVKNAKTVPAKPAHSKPVKAAKGKSKRK
ncbi:MAG: hypothetical protein H8K04_06880 [Nitrospira sp.]